MSYSSKQMSFFASGPEINQCLRGWGLNRLSRDLFWVSLKYSVRLSQETSTLRRSVLLGTDPGMVVEVEETAWFWPDALMIEMDEPCTGAGSTSRAKSSGSSATCFESGQITFCKKKKMSPKAGVRSIRSKVRNKVREIERYHCDRLPNKFRDHRCHLIQGLIRWACPDHYRPRS